MRQGGRRATPSQIITNKNEAAAPPTIAIITKFYGGVVNRLMQNFWSIQNLSGLLIVRVHDCVSGAASATSCTQAVPGCLLDFDVAFCEAGLLPLWDNCRECWALRALRSCCFCALTAARYSVFAAFSSSLTLLVSCLATCLSACCFFLYKAAAASSSFIVVRS
jgi:hypothetical protein